eukprot:s747_g11.t1
MFVEPLRMENLPWRAHWIGVDGGGAEGEGVDAGGGAEEQRPEWLDEKEERIHVGKGRRMKHVEEDAVVTKEVSDEELVD